MVGSSPLARGLRTGHFCEIFLSGIIPARAGFTAVGVVGHGVIPDHPRSRGVYRSRGVIARGVGGSSPLARGLLAPGNGLIDHTRIIPARAGFTAELSVSPWILGDHPRSRGVYIPRSFIRRRTRGSSPLARGLPPSPIPSGSPRRIIPARAGFTRPRGRSEPRSKDHPRSRGVYNAVYTGSRVRAGSSPLARGLRGIGVKILPAERIIPARAGFTLPEIVIVRHIADHPRSRGVYALVNNSVANDLGSSPLARGLPPPEGRPAPAGRIIPARAGFTAGPHPYGP